MARPATALAPWPFRVRPLTPSLGAEVLDLVLADRMDDATFDALYQAFLRYQVLLFPAQDVPPARQVAKKKALRRPSAT